MAGEIVASNECLKERAIRMRNDFQSDTTLRLFSNDFKPTYSDRINAFAECSFLGYARVNMNGKWRDVFKVEDGKWMFQSKDITFAASAPTNEKAVGWFLVQSGIVQLSCRLPFPLLMTVGNVLTVRADVIVWAATKLGEEK